MTEPTVSEPWLPTPDDVARWVARLTPRPDGGYEFRFTSDTVPTDAQVAEILSQSAAEVRVSVGATGDPQYDPWIRALVAMEAAAQVIISYDPGATDAAERLHAWYEQGLTRLMALARPGTEGGGGTAQPITGFVGVVGSLVWSMPPGPYDVVASPLSERPYGWLYGDRRFGVPPAFDGV